MDNNRIVDYLMDKRVKPQNNGFKYIYAAIELCLKEGEVPKVTKLVYPHVAKKFGTTPSKVERAMRHEIGARGLTNKEFIATAIIELSRKKSK